MPLPVTDAPNPLDTTPVGWALRTYKVLDKFFDLGNAGSDPQIAIRRDQQTPAEATRAGYAGDMHDLMELRREGIDISRQMERLLATKAGMSEAAAASRALIGEWLPNGTGPYGVAGPGQEGYDPNSPVWDPNFNWDTVWNLAQAAKDDTSPPGDAPFALGDILPEIDMEGQPGVVITLPGGQRVKIGIPGLSGFDLTDIFGDPQDVPDPTQDPSQGGQAPDEPPTIPTPPPSGSGTPPDQGPVDIPLPPPAEPAPPEQPVIDIPLPPLDIPPIDIPTTGGTGGAAPINDDGPVDIPTPPIIGSTAPPTIGDILNPTTRPANPRLLGPLGNDYMAQILALQKVNQRAPGLDFLAPILAQRNQDNGNFRK